MYKRQDWDRADRHETRVVSTLPNSTTLARRLDADGYRVRLHWAGDARAEPAGAHRILLALSLIHI